MLGQFSQFSQFSFVWHYQTCGCENRHPALSQVQPWPFFNMIVLSIMERAKKIRENVEPITIKIDETHPEINRTYENLFQQLKFMGWAIVLATGSIIFRPWLIVWIRTVISPGYPYGHRIHWGHNQILFSTTRKVCW